jgi:hypothetical protein
MFFVFPKRSIHSTSALLPHYLKWTLKFDSGSQNQTNVKSDQCQAFWFWATQRRAIKPIGLLTSTQCAARDIEGVTPRTTCCSPGSYGISEVGEVWALVLYAKFNLPIFVSWVSHTHGASASGENYKIVSECFRQIFMYAFIIHTPAIVIRSAMHEGTPYSPVLREMKKTRQTWAECS